MNRHQRRRLKKEKEVGQPFQQELINAIKIHKEKNYELAEEEYTKLLKKVPNDYETLRLLGVLYFDTLRMEEAYNCFQKAVQINPSRCEAYNNLGSLHIKNGNLELAEKCLLKSCKIKPKYIPALNNLAGLYINWLQPDPALKYAKKVVALDPNNPISNSQLGKALIFSGRLIEGTKILERLYEKSPQPEFRLNLATAYRENGEMEKSDQIVKEEFIRNFKDLNYFCLYAINKSNSLSNEHIKYYNDIIKSNAKKDPTILKNQIKLCETFYIYYRNHKDFDKSSEYLLKMNKLQFSMKNYNLKLEENFFKTMKDIFSNDLDFIPKKTGNIVPIFICGMPRSGTTLCEQILSSHSNVTGAGELNYLASLTGIVTSVQVEQEVQDKFKKNVYDNNFLQSVRQEYMKKLIERRENKELYISDKMPHNFVFIGLIKSIFPEAKIIYCKRDPIDNCFSLYAHKFVEMSHLYSYDQITLAKYYTLHSDLMNFWLNKYENQIYVLDNEELIKNQEKISKEIVNFCGLDWEEQCLRFYETKRQVRTASIDQVRQPLNNKSIGAWKNYKSSLTELIKQLH